MCWMRRGGGANDCWLVSAATIDCVGWAGVFGMSEMNAWRSVELPDLVEIDPEVLSENTDRDYYFHCVDIASVTEGRVDMPSVTIPFRSSPSRARKVVRRGDVLMSTVRPNLKAFAYFDHPYVDCVASTGFAVLRTKQNVDPRFVLYSILSEPVTRQIESLIVGSNYPAINSTAVSQLKALTPTSTEQTKIAEALSTVDRAIEQTEALIAKQQRINTGLMQDLLSKGIDEHGNLRSEATFSAVRPFYGDRIERRSTDRATCRHKTKHAQKPSDRPCFD